MPKKNPESITPAIIAAWMLEKLKKQGELYQDDAANSIAEKFGEEFGYYNDNGGLCIDKKVLLAFRKLTGDSVVWDRISRFWRPREQSDNAGRQQS